MYKKEYVTVVRGKECTIRSFKVFVHGMDARLFPLGDRSCEMDKAE